MIFKPENPDKNGNQLALGYCYFIILVYFNWSVKILYQNNTELIKIKLCYNNPQVLRSVSTNELNKLLKNILEGKLQHLKLKHLKYKT